MVINQLHNALVFNGDCFILETNAFIANYFIVLLLSTFFLWAVGIVG